MLVLWLVVAAWMLFSPRGAEQLPDNPATTTPATGLVGPTGEPAPPSSFDPGVYNGKLNTPTVSPHPSPQTSPTARPSATQTPSAPAPAPTTPPPVPQPTGTTGPGRGHGHGHGKP
jgi:hypothetical protein